MLDYLPPPVVSLAVSVIVFGVIFGASPKINYFQNQFFERDASLSYYKTDGDQVSNDKMRLITITISVITVIVYAACSSKVGRVTIQPRRMHSRFYLFFYFGLGLAAVILGTDSATTILKKVIGSPRPSAFYLCNYKGYADAVNSGNFTTYNSLTSANAKGYVSNCYDNYDHAWSSFPSGHASLSFATMVYTTWLWRDLFKIGEQDYMTLGNFVAFAPIVVAAWISLTRLIDHKHHVEDVVGGALIGAAIGLLSFWTVHECVYGRRKSDGDDDEAYGPGSETGVEVAHKHTLEDALLR